MTEIAGRDEGLREPRDLDFNPEQPGQLWIVNRADDSVVTLEDVNDRETADKRLDPYAMHFMEEVPSISFASGQKFGTCGDSRNTYNGLAEANDFIGPALWSAEPDVFAKTNPAAVSANQGNDLGSHLDMMHETPECIGIAWETQNVYFAFEGLTGTIARYDFADNHGPGFDDHTDGFVERFIDADVARVAGVPSHMAYDHDSDLLYVADTGNARIGVLDISTASAGGAGDGWRRLVDARQRKRR